MECPDYRLPGLLQIPKQLLHVQVKAVDIVEMNDIRIIFLDLFYQSARLLFGSKAVLPPEKGMKHMEAHVQVRSEFIRGDSLRPGPAAKGHHSLVSLFLQGMYDIHRDTAHASASADGINL